MDSYPEKSVKWDPETGAVAVRTRFPDMGNFTGMAWMVAASAGGARNASTSDVAAWVDIPAELLATLIPITESED